ncbi:uncharacterized protein LOC132830055 [Hemiscyllium ocellatum]|uniref:uncharacterized protein LOC132830055 n=1 Tax=Hemiscyllium ocellatum TaxID=170820 RepID=UPI002966BA72|nr:uncharacterized protein LOC132830055 [Hemiscyllium ocellatum]
MAAAAPRERGGLRRRATTAQARGDGAGRRGRHLVRAPEKAECLRESGLEVLRLMEPNSQHWNCYRKPGGARHLPASRRSELLDHVENRHRGPARLGIRPGDTESRIQGGPTSSGSRLDLTRTPHKADPTSLGTTSDLAVTRGTRCLPASQRLNQLNRIENHHQSLTSPGARPDLTVTRGTRHLQACRRPNQLDRYRGLTTSGTRLDLTETRHGGNPTRQTARPPGALAAATNSQDPTKCTHLSSGMVDSPHQFTDLTRSSHQPRKRGKRAGLQVRLKQRGFKSPLPSIFLTNIQAIESKLDELKARLIYQRELRDCCVLCFTETWLSPAISDCALQPEGFSVHRMDRKMSSGKARGGGVCLLINNSWCSDVATLASYCSPDLEYLTVKCRPYYLPREFTCAILTAVYIPPHAEVQSALHEIYTVTNRLSTKYPEALFIIAGDFNQANLKSVLPKYHQHVSCPTKGPNILDHCYTNIKDAYRSIPRPHFGKSDRTAVYLLPAYKQKLKREDPVQKVVQCWSDGTDELLQDCFESVDWSIFKNSATSLNEYATTVTDFISKCVEDCVPKKLIRVFPNQKPWMNSEIHSLLKSRSEAFKSGDPDLYKKSRYDLRKAIRDAKRQYQTKLESQTNHMNISNLWQGLHDLIGYKAKSNRIASSNTSLSNEHNAFYAGSEQKICETLSTAPIVSGAPVPTITAADVRSAFLKVNPQKVTGPDGIPGRALTSCADQLAGVFADIFNLSLLQSEIPTCFKKTTVTPMPKENEAACVNDYHPVTLTSVVMKCFERLVMAHINSSLPDCLDPLQFIYHRNRPTPDAAPLGLHSPLERLDNYIRLIDYRPAFNTIIPIKLLSKL